jgi:hypothetical protein
MCTRGIAIASAAVFSTTVRVRALTLSSSRFDQRAAGKKGRSSSLLVRADKVG